MPTFQKGASGRDHNPAGFTAWMAGAGEPRSPTERPTILATRHGRHRHRHDFHATILHLLGLDHERLSFYHNGIERR